MATVLTTIGKGIVTNRLRGAGTEPIWIAWGTGAGTAAVGDAALFTEASEARTVGTPTRVTTTVANDTWQLTGTITVAGAGKTITNAGCFDSLTSGGTNLLFIHGDHSSTTLAIGESIAYTITVQFT